MKFVDLKGRAARGCGILALLVTIGGCNVYVIYHDEDVAAQSAERFAELAFIDGEIADVYSTMAEEARASFSVDRLRQAITAIHPKSRPRSVVAREFEPLLGQRAMYIYLEGSAPQELFYYRFLMMGDGNAGYQVGGVERRAKPYPSSQREPL